MLNSARGNRSRCHLLIFVVFMVVMVNPASAKGSSLKIDDGSVTAMMERAEPLIEEITGRTFKEKMVYKLVTRDVFRDLMAEELLPVYKTMMTGASDDIIARQVESSAHSMSQALLGKYSPLKKEFYIIPDNLNAQVKTFEIKDQDLNDFVFFFIAHEMVGVLNDQYYDLQNKTKSINNAEAAQSVRALSEGHAVYVINKIAERLKLSETARDLSIKSAAGLTSESNVAQKQQFQFFYVKSAEFVEAIINKKGLSGLAEAFASPPLTVRQITNPDEYLAPSTAGAFDCAGLLEKVTGKLPVDGMETQSAPLDPMTLSTALVSQGLPENEANSATADCLNGASFIAVKQAEKPSMVVATVLNFTTGEAAARYLALNRRLENSAKAQINATLNSSYKVIKQEDLKLDGFDSVHYQHVKITVDEDLTTQQSADGTINNLYVAVAFVNPEKEQTERGISEILTSLNKERLTMK